MLVSVGTSRRRLGICAAALPVLALSLVVAALTSVRVARASTMGGVVTVSNVPWFVVPAGVTAVNVVAHGGPGPSGVGGVAGGLAASVTATVPVVPGDALYLRTAAQPEGAFGGYAVYLAECPSESDAACTGGAGWQSTVLLVASGGGGGGNGGQLPGTFAGGDANGVGTMPFTNAAGSGWTGGSGQGAMGGSGGQGASGGAGGTTEAAGDTTPPTDGQPGYSVNLTGGYGNGAGTGGENGGMGGTQGRVDASGQTYLGAAGGFGGGGYFGGGGGAGSPAVAGEGGTGGGGGGAGSSFVVAGSRSVSFGNDVSRTPMIAITFTAPLVVNSTAMTDDPVSSLNQGVCNTTPSGAQATCTLPAAIELANANAGATIRFDIPAGNGNAFDGSVPKIATSSTLPAITAPVTIDGTTQPGASEVEVAGQSELGAKSGGGLVVAAGGAGSTIKGMVINGFQWELRLDGGSNTVQDDFIGTDPTGTIARNVYMQAAILLQSAGNQIGGDNSSDGNVIADLTADGAMSGRGGEGGAIWDTGDGSWGGATSGGASVNDNTIEGNSIGVQRRTDTLLAGAWGHAFPALAVFLDEGTGNRLGGPTLSDGNVIGGLSSLGHADFVQGNTVTAAGGLEVFGPTLVGGATTVPGTAPGNRFVGPDAGMNALGGGVVVQGNLFEHNDDYGIGVSGDDSTIGGANKDLGNEIVGDGTTDLLRVGGKAGIDIRTYPNSVPADVSDDNLVENNVIEGNGGIGGVEVEQGVGNHITDNVMKGNTLGIDLGGGPFVYNSIRPFSTGANNLQLYPDLLAAPDVGGTVDVSGQLEDFAHHSGFTIDLYTQGGCARDSVTPGQGEHLVTERVVSTNLVGVAPFSIRLPRSGPRGGALTVTATSSDGSTSEFSPCLTIGHTAATFTGSGVTVPGATIDASSLTTAGSKSDITRTARAVTAKKKLPPTTARLVASLHPFCPAVTTGFCAGTILVRQRSETTLIARLKFKLAPDDLGSLTFQLSKQLAKLLERTHRVKLISTIMAHDGAKREHHRTTTAHLTLRLAKAS